MDFLSKTDVQDLLDYFSKNYYRIRDNPSKVNEVLQRCQMLFSKDYKIEIINNLDGELSNSYPPKIFIPVHSLGETTQDRFKLSLDGQRLRDIMVRARVARCRTRFPVPIMLFRDKFICRSSTLSGGAEIYGRKGMQYLFSGRVDEEEFTDDEESLNMPSSSDWMLSRGFDKVRNLDIRLLKMLDVQVICDLMVENKKVKFGLNITSSEKIDKENRYQDFTIISMPYPGCEFFKVYRDKNYNATGLVYDWNQSFVDAALGIPEDAITLSLGIDWGHYKHWDLITLTQNYLKLILKYITDGHNGVLVHCISGWDRTPLYVSLLRLSLWADGKIHPTLSSCQILYLTLAYDWFLFGHNLVDRLNKGEEILCYCFDMLRFITSNEYSAQIPLRDRRNNSGSDVDPSEILLEYSNQQAQRAKSLAAMAESPDEEDDDDEEEEDEGPPTLTNSTTDDLPESFPNSSSPSKEMAYIEGGMEVEGEVFRVGGEEAIPIPVPKCPSIPEDLSSFSSSSPYVIAQQSKPRSESTSSGSWQFLSYSESNYNPHETDKFNRNVGFLESGTLRQQRLLEVNQLFYSMYFNGVLGRPRAESLFGSLWDKVASGRPF